MRSRDWVSVDAAVNELDRLVAEFEVPGDRPGTIQCIEENLRIIEAAGLAADKCASLRTASRTFHMDRGRRSRTTLELDYRHWRLVGYISSIRMCVAMLKAAEAGEGGAGDIRE